MGHACISQREAGVVVDKEVRLLKTEAEESEGTKIVKQTIIEQRMV